MIKAVRQAIRDHQRAFQYQWERRPGADWPGSSKGDMDPTYVPPAYRLARFLRLKP